MYIKNLKLKNIGPFNEASLNFESVDENDSLPVIIITGENGTGKSIIIDAIRTVFLGDVKKIERNITTNANFYIQCKISLEKDILSLGYPLNNRIHSFFPKARAFHNLFSTSIKYRGFKEKFCVNYWSSKISNVDFKISSIKAPSLESPLVNSLNGIHSNTELVELVTYFEYLSDSQIHQEAEIRKKVFGIIKTIFDKSIPEGKLSHISRTTLQPIISIFNRDVSLDKLSSGNLYLIQRLIYILKQMYIICVKNEMPISEIQTISGVILIDGAENHLHPKWQKVFLNNIHELFPNLQLIVTTHSPFIVSSVENARIYVCKSQIEGSIISEETDYYANKPVEEILMSPLFNTSNFGKEISDLMQARKIAVLEKKDEDVKLIEAKLLEKNPEYFNYLNLNEIMKSINIKA